MAEEPTDRPATASPQQRLRGGPWQDSGPGMAAAEIQPPPPIAPGDDQAHRARRLARKYGWLLAAGAVALAVLLCSIPVLSNAGVTWNPGGPAVTDPMAATTPSEPLAAVAASPSPTPSPTSRPPSPSRRSPTPSNSKPKPKPTLSTTAPTLAVPVLLGPAAKPALRDMLDAYCRDQYDDEEIDAGLRSGTDPATNNWECQIRGVRDDPLIDITAACVRQYGPGAFAAFTNAHDAYSWRCYRR